MGESKNNILLEISKFEEYIEDINKLLKKINGNNISEIKKLIDKEVEKLKDSIDETVAQSIKDIKEEKRRENLKVEINKYIENAVKTREEEAKRKKEEAEMWQQRKDETEYAERQEKEILEYMDYKRRKPQIEEAKRQEEQRKKSDKEKRDAEKDLAKCDEIFSRVENGYKDLLVNDIFYQNIKEELIIKYPAEKLEKALKGKNIPEIYDMLIKKCSQEYKIKLIDRFKNIREREELLQKQPYRVINNEIQLSVYFTMIEKQFKNSLPKAYEAEKQRILENYSEKNTYIMPEDILAYFKEILMKLGCDEQFPEKYDQEDVKELKLAIQQINQQKSIENMEPKKELIEETLEKESTKKETTSSKNNIFRNIYESIKGKVTSIFTRNKAQNFPIDNKSNKSIFKEKLGKGAPTPKKQAENAKQYQENQKSTKDRALDKINNIINNNYSIR